MMVVWRAHRRRARRSVWSVVLTIGVLGGIALAALTGARQTASTFAAYERNVKLSDLAVNTYTPDLARVHAVARLPDVRSSATYLGLNAFPVVDGKVITAFTLTGVFGSLDGRFFTQDIATVLHGRLPKLDSTDEVAVSPKIAAALHVGVGDPLPFLFKSADFSKTVGRTTFRVVGVVRLPPVIVDENDVIEGTILPPARTKAHLQSEYYAWQGIRLDDGARGIRKFTDSLRTNPTVNKLAPVTQRYDQTRVQAQRSIRPQAVALALFGLAAFIAALALGGLGLSRLVGRWAGERLVLRAMGLTRRQLATLFGLDALVAIALGLVLAVVIALLLSPLWPIGDVRDIAPSVGVHADLTVLLGAGAVFALGLVATAALVAWRAAGGVGATTRARPSTVVAAASRNGVPVPGVLGAHFALDRGDTRQPVPVRATLLAGALATVAVITALVFGASLQSLASHPKQYGWAWDRMLIAEAGYGSLDGSAVAHLVDRDPSVTGWSLVTFDTLTVNDTRVPVIGLDRRVGDVEPPVLTGRAVAGDHEIVLGALTLREIGKKVGDSIRVDVGAQHGEFTIVGTDTFPSIGVGGGDHVSLGRGALVSYHALAELVAPGKACLQTEDALCPRAVVFDVKHGTTGARLVQRIAAANPDGTPGGTYEQPTTRAADIRNYDEMGSFPMLLATLLAAAAAIAFLVTLIASVRARRRDLAVLRTIGLTKRQIRMTLIAQTVLTVFITLAIGIPLGLLVGRITWIHFANDIGVIAQPTIPLLAMFVIGGVATVLCTLFTLFPAATAARIPPAKVLRAE